MQRPWFSPLSGKQSGSGLSLEMGLCSVVVGNGTWAEDTRALGDGLGIVETDGVGLTFGVEVGVGILSNEGALSLGLGWTLKVERWRSSVTYRLLRTRPSTQPDTHTHHRRVHLVFRDLIFKEKFTGGLELSTLVERMFNGSHQITVHKVWLDHVRNDPRLVPEDAAPEGGSNFLLRMAKLG